MLLFLFLVIFSVVAMSSPYNYVIISGCNACSTLASLDFGNRNLSLSMTSATPMPNPSWIVSSSDYLTKLLTNTYIYSVFETKLFSAEGSGAVGAYKLNRDGSLNLINVVGTVDSTPVHMSLYNVPKSDRYRLFIANNVGSVTVLQANVATDGSIDDAPLQYIKYPVPDGATSNPFLHQIIVYKDYAYAVDRNTDRIYIYPINLSSGLLEEQLMTTLLLSSGSGPRHLAFHPTQPLAFLVSEFASSMTLLSVAADRPSEITVVAVYSMLRPNETTDDMAGGGKFFIARVSLTYAVYHSGVADAYYNSL